MPAGKKREKLNKEYQADYNLPHIAMALLTFITDKSFR
jgi:hypothetical protein